MTNKKDMINFIMSARATKEYELNDSDFYNFVYTEYLRYSTGDLQIEFDFYKNF